MSLLLSECWALFRYRTAKVLVFVSVGKVYCLLITPVFNCTGEQWLGGLCEGTILFRQQGFVWHLVLILLVYASSLPDFFALFSPCPLSFPSYFFISNVPSTISVLSLTGVLTCTLSVPLFLWSPVDAPGFRRRSLLHHCPLVVFSPLWGASPLSPPWRGGSWW